MYLIDPLTDPRWATLVERHSAACAFHTQGWLRALWLTYGYTPLAVTSSAPAAALSDALPICRVESWVTGRRLVSLPFTDHCQPLISAGAMLDQFIQFVSHFAENEKLRFVEVRPAAPVEAGCLDAEHRSSSYRIHWLDTTPPLDKIFASFDKDSIQRKIRRAERERLAYEEGRTPEFVNRFYRLLVRTRRRHQLPPQPVEWFQNLAQQMPEAIQFRIAIKETVPIAAIVTLKHRNCMTYKYGCSDERYHATGSMPFLFWRMIQEAKEDSIPLVDFGRSDLDNPGLIRFKDQWGTRKAELTYYRFPPAVSARDSAGLPARAAKAVLARVPDRMLTVIGRLIYRHIG